jgi:hypothetical protein
VRRQVQSNQYLNNFDWHVPQDGIASSPGRADFITDPSGHKRQSSRQVKQAI